MTIDPGVELRDRVQTLIREREEEGIRGLAERIGPAEWADIVPHLEPPEVAVLLHWLPDHEVPGLLEELSPGDAARVLRTLTAPEAARLLQDMDPDDATDVVGRLPERDASDILIRMRPDEAAEIRQLATYPPDTAGGIMTPAFVAVTRDATAAEAMRAIRRLVDQAETVNYIYIIDPGRRLLGVLSLPALLLADPEAPVTGLMVAHTVRVHAGTDQEVAARLLTDRNFLALPVVDDDDRILGIITEDDVADVLVEEATEDIERLGGTVPLHISYRSSSVALLFRKRIVWLLLLFVAAAYTASVVQAFEDELAGVVALAFFIPLLIGTGGNIGSQTVTLVVRAMAVGEVGLRDIGWIIFKELRVGLAIGVVMALIAFGRAEMLGVGHDVSMVVSVTILIICLWSAIVAAALPLIIRRLRFDPAVVSAPLITTLVDGTGLLIYFEIARRMLSLSPGGAA